MGPLKTQTLTKWPWFFFTSQMLVDANWQQEFADSSCLVLQGRWDLRSSPKTTAGEKNMVAPLTQELLNSNPSLSSKLQCLWIYTKQNICQRGDLYRGTDTSCVVHVFKIFVILFAFVSLVFKQCLCEKSTWSNISGRNFIFCNCCDEGPDTRGQCNLQETWGFLFSLAHREETTVFLHQSTHFPTSSLLKAAQIVKDL